MPIERRGGNRGKYQARPLVVKKELTGVAGLYNMSCIRLVITILEPSTS